MALAIAAAVSCGKDGVLQDPMDIMGQEIVLGVADASSLQVQTKATALTALPSTLYWEGTSGTQGSETAKWGSSQASVTSGKISTGRYQSATAAAYNYYVASSAITFAPGGSTISASNTSDVIAGCTTAATTSTAPSVVLDHVFARTGTLTANAPSGYTVSGVSWKIQSRSGGTGGTAGTYNIATRGWSGVTALAQQALTSSSDLYCTPGVYTVTVTYTLSKGDYSKTSTRSGDVTLVAGKVNSITCTCPVDGTGAEQIVLGVSLTPWGTNGITLNLG